MTAATTSTSPLMGPSVVQSGFETDQGPLFVVGMWRSGTSLFYRLINQHPKIALMYEGDLALFRPLFASGKRRSAWTEHWDFWSGALRRHSIDPASIPEGIQDFKTAIETVYRAYAGPDAIWGCKSPNYYDRMDMLHDMFPNARFIVIWRDPRDVCRSVARAGEAQYSWFSRRWMFERALFGCRTLRGQYETLVQRNARVHQIQYEDLVRTPSDVMTGICEFLDLPFDPRTVSLTGGDHSAIENATHHEKVKSDRIIIPGEREEVLTVEQKRKIDSYTKLWQSQFHGEWPKLRKPLGAEVTTPSLFVRFFDAIKYRAIRAYDSFRLRVYCVAPMWLLKKYRTLIRKPLPLSPQNAVKPVSTQ
jgi:Sulfotransferase family